MSIFSPIQRIVFSLNDVFLKSITLFGCAGSLLLCRLLSSCGKWGLLSSCGACATHCSGFSCYRAVSRAFGLQQLWHVGSVVAAPMLWNIGSVVVAHGSSCPAACGFFLDQRSNPCLLYWSADSLPLSHQGSPLARSFEAQRFFILMMPNLPILFCCLYFSVIYVFFFKLHNTRSQRFTPCFLLTVL